MFKPMTHILTVTVFVVLGFLCIFLIPEGWAEDKALGVLFGVTAIISWGLAWVVNKLFDEKRPGEV